MAIEKVTAYMAQDGQLYDDLKEAHEANAHDQIAQLLADDAGLAIDRITARAVAEVIYKERDFVIRELADV